MLYLLDTNIVSFLMTGNQKVLSEFNKCLSTGNIVRIPEIVYYEIERGLFYNNSVSKQQAFDRFFNYYGLQEMTPSTLLLAAKLYADLKTQGKLIEDDDIMIGASAIENNAVLVTNNTQHMQRLNNILLADWSV